MGDRPQFSLLGGERWRDPWGLYARLRDEDPVHRAPAGHWVLSRFEDVFDAARDPATFSSAHGLTISGDDTKALALAPTVVMLDPPEHTAFRRLVSRGFTPRRVATLEPAVRAFVVERVEALRSAGEADLIEVLAKPLPSFVVAHYLGVPEADRARFDDWSAALVAANAAGDPLAGATEAIGELYEYFTSLAQRRRDEPGDDMVSQLLAAELDGEPVDVPVVLGYAFVMIAGGNDTATGLLGGAADLLTRHPEQRTRLLDDPSLIGGAVEELLRLTSPVQGLARTATRDVEVRGERIAAGEKVLLLYGAANRDRREFGDDADELDVTRPVPRMMTFSSGPHHCLGAAAARLQGRVVLEELLARCPRFAADGDAGTFAPGGYVRRFQSLPFTAG